MSEREIKVTKCGEQQGCLFDDCVSIEFTPSELEALKYIFEQRAINATRYDKQGDERDMCELYTRARKMWEKARKEEEKKDKK